MSDKKCRGKRKSVGTNEERPVEDIKLVTNKDYKNYIEQLHEEAVALKIKILDTKCDYQALMRKISLIESERYAKFNKETSKKVKKETEKTGDKS